MRMDEVFGPLTEMPRKIHQNVVDGFGSSRNLEILLRYVEQDKTKVVVQKAKSFVLYKRKRLGLFQYIGVDTFSNEVCYYSEWDMASIDSKKVPCQKMVWRDNDSSAPQNIVIDMMFKQIEDFGAIISDEGHTPKGIALWKRFINEAFGKGLKIGIAIEDGVEEWVSKERMSFLIDALWDKENQHTSIIISR